MPKKAAQTAKSAEFATEIKIDVIALEDLRPYANNARKHSADQVEQIKGSMREFGWTNPILADMSDDGLIFAGHGRPIVDKHVVEARDRLNDYRRPARFD